MNLGIADRVALVTGSSRGIGKAVAEVLCEEGVHVALIARDHDRLDEMARELSSRHGVRAVPVAADLASPGGPGRAIDEARDQLGDIDILVNNAGDIPPGGLVDLDEEEIARVWELKLWGYIRTCRALVPRMRELGWGRVVNVVGNAGKKPGAGSIYGGTANAALINFSLALAAEVAGDNVLVNVVNPGPIDTDRLRALAARRAADQGVDVADYVRTRDASFPMGRPGTPREVADVVAFLASERCGYLAGAVIPVEGALRPVL